MKIENPILRGFNPDPCICRHGEDYYIATSTFEWFPGVQIHHSRDLKNWRLLCRPLDRISQLDMRGNPDSGGVWAPALSYYDGLFWLIYTDAKSTRGAFKDNHNYLVTCDTIDGKWSEPIYLNSSGFDPSLFHDDDGRKYIANMFWNHRVGEHSFHGVVIQQYCHEAKRLIGEPQIIFKGTEFMVTEAPHIYKIDGWYYLVTAEGGTGWGHVASIARSRDLRGPYEVHPANPLITSRDDIDFPFQKAGHASIVQTHTDEWYAVYLMSRPIEGEHHGRGSSSTHAPLTQHKQGFCVLGRESAIKKLEWRDGWPWSVGSSLPNLAVDAPKMTEHLWPKSPTKDDFDSEALDINFQTLRIPLGEDILTLKERTGYLRLYGRESFASTFTQALVARRWQTLFFDAACKVEFMPTNLQHSAGLTCYYNTMNWTAIYITWSERMNCRAIDMMIADYAQFSQPLSGKEIPIPYDASVEFKVEVRGGVYYYFYSFDSKKWHKIDVKLQSFKLSDDYTAGTGSFTGAFVGMFCQDLSGTRKHADFDYFLYDEKSSPQVF